LDSFSSFLEMKTMFKRDGPACQINPKG
jgi:hypothetical protein